MKTLLLIDTNALIHRSFHALPPLTSPKGEPVQALYGVSAILLKILREEKPEYVMACLDRPEPTFRKKAFSEYKAHRPKAADELVSQIIKSRELLSEFKIKSFELPGFEADDLLGTAVARFKNTPDLRLVILTGDLDALQLVEGGKVVVRTLKTGISETLLYDEAAVIKRYGLKPKELPDYKALVGDPSDNIPGLPGVGPKTAAGLLQKYHSLESLYANLKKEPKIFEKFNAAKGDAFLYKKLSKINEDAPIVFGNLDGLRAHDFSESLSAYFLSLGFQSLAKRLGQKESFVAEKVTRDAGSASTKDAARGLFSLDTKNQIKSREKDDNILIVRNATAIYGPKELSSVKLKIGFSLKEFIKKSMASGAVVRGPYFDLGVGFWLLDPDFKKYNPDSVFKKFLNRAWSGDDDDYLSAHRFLEGQLDSLALRKVFERIEMPSMEPLAAMEATGILVDGKKLAILDSDIGREIAGLTKTIHVIAGSKINLNSPKQLSELLFQKLKISGEKIKKTASGQISTNFDSLSALRGAHTIISHLLDYREIFKLKSTYIEPILEKVDADHRLHTDFVQTAAATGRLSSQNPNLQNVPSFDKAEGAITKKDWARRLRSVFVAPPKFTLAAFDYSQLELRILASVSEDKTMINAFRQGEDIHAATASAVFQIPLSKVTPDLRRVAKTLNFGIIYGMGADAFAKTAGVKRAEAQEFIKNYFAAFPGIKLWQEKTKSEGRQFGYVKNLNGRRRNVTGITYGKSRLASEAERIAINMPIQGLEADIIKLAMIKVYEAIKDDRERVRMLLSIHDELLFEIRSDIMTEVSGRIQTIMESVFKLSVPLTVNVKFGKDWASLI